MTGDLQLVSIQAIKTIVDQLNRLGIDPLHLHVDGHKPTSPSPDVRLWLRYRTDFERFVTDNGWPAKRVAERSGYAKDRQREFSVVDDNEARKLLVACVSFPHHPDWQAAS